MPTLKADFVSDWQDSLRETMRTIWGDQVDAIARDNLPVRFFDSFRRRIPVAPRALKISDVFSVPIGFEQGWATFSGKVSQGGDLNPHLSGAHQSLLNHDGLLNDWGVHHFHLGLKPQAKKPHLIERTGPVVIAYVTADTFYAIGIYGHKPAPWSKQELVETLHRNWPDAIKKFLVNGFSGDGLSEEQRTNLRNKNCAVFVEVSDGTVYMPMGGFMSGAGTEMQAQRQADIWHAEIMGLQKDCENQITAFTDVLQQLGHEAQGNVDGHLIFLDDEYALSFPQYGEVLGIKLTPPID